MADTDILGTGPGSLPQPSDIFKVHQATPDSTGFVQGLIERQRQKEQSSYSNLPMDAYMFLRDGVNDGTLTPEDAELWSAAFTLQQRTGRSIEELKSEVDAYAASLPADENGKRRKFIGAELVDAWTRSRVREKIEGVWHELRQAELSGSKAEIEYYRNELAEYQKDLEQLADPEADKRNLLSKAAIGFMENARYMLYLGVSGAIGGAAGGGLGALAGPAGAKVGGQAGKIAASTAMAYHLTDDTEYGSLRAAGVLPEIADEVTPWITLGNALIESVVSDAMSGLVGKGAAKVTGSEDIISTVSGTISQAVLNKIHASGLPLKEAIAKILRLPISGFWEGAEEFMQNWEEWGGIIAADKRQRDRIREAVENPLNPQNRAFLERYCDELEADAIDGMTAIAREAIISQLQDKYKVEIPGAGEQLNQALAEFGMGVLIGGFSEGISIGIDTLDAVKEANKLKAAARDAGSQAEYNEITKGSRLFEGLKPETIEKIQQGTYQKAARSRERGEAARAEELKKERLYGAVSQQGEAARDEAGRLRAENERIVASDGTVTGLYAAGNPDAGGAFEEAERDERGAETGGTTRVSGTFAAIAWEERGGTVAVTGFGMSPNLRNDAALRAEVFKGFATDMGQAITWQGETYAPGEVTANVSRFGFDREAAATTEAGAAQSPGSAADIAGEGALTDRRYAAPDTQADIDAKASFRRQIAAADTRLRSDAEIDTVVDFYDQVGRKWFNTGFDGLIKKLAADPDRLITQELGDAQIAAWYRTKLSPEEMAARGIDLENLSAEQRETARNAIRGVTINGLDGVTKAIYAAKNADLATFLHEGIHAFTNLASAADPELYRRMMEAAGLDQSALGKMDKAEREAAQRNAWEKLAYGAERYFRDGALPGNNSALRELYERLKEFLKDLVNVLDQRKQLTPEIKALYDELFSDKAGEGAGRAQEGLQNEKRHNDTAAGQSTQQRAAMTQPEANAGGAEAELEIFSDEDPGDNQYDRIIRDTNRPIEERGEAAVAKAGEAYTDALLEPQDRAHRPTAELIKRAARIADGAERERIIADIRALRDRYAGTQAEFKAPNGKPSLLLESLGKEQGQQAWYAVRTPDFKNWFGDWERAAKIAEIEKTAPKEITIGKPKSQKEAEVIARSFTQIKNSTDGRIAEIPVNTIGKVFGHKGFDITQIIEHIPALYETSLLGWSEPEIQREGHKAHPNIRAYHQYINKFTDGTGEYFIRFTVHEEKAKPKKTGKNFIHSAAISNITIQKNGDHLQRIRENSPGEASPSPLYDSKLAEFLNSVNADSVSKVIDKNGEPLVVYHNTSEKRIVFDRKYVRKSMEIEAHFFAPEIDPYGEYGPIRNDVFLRITNPADYNTAYEGFSAGKTDDSGIVQREKLQAQGYDGGIMVEDGKTYEYFVFDSNQIKSATENAGTYGPDTPSILFQDAWHGSPYRFEKFDSAHMGTGEGAQAYGWGHYFASKKEIAEWYKEELTGYRVELSELTLPEQEKILAIADETGLAKFITGGEGDLDIAALQEWTADSGNKDFYELLSGWLGSEEKAQELLAGNGLKELLPGQLYRVDIPGDEEMLDWDKPILEQPENIQKLYLEIFKNLRSADYEDFSQWGENFEYGTKKYKNVDEFLLANTKSGKRFYKDISIELGSDRAASQYLASLGIKGIRYLDGSSRADGAGTHNYVIFSDDDIQITQTFYQDEELAAFINNYPYVVDRAAKVDSGAELAEELADYGAMSDEVYKRALALKYFDDIHRAVKAGEDPQAVAEERTDSDWKPEVSQGTGVSARKAVAALGAYGITPEQAMEAARLARGKEDYAGAARLLERMGTPRIDAESYVAEARLFSHSEWNWLKRAAKEAAQTIEEEEDNTTGPIDSGSEQVRPDTIPDRADGQDSDGDQRGAVRSELVDRDTGSVEDAGGRQGRGDSGTENGVRLGAQPSPALTGLFARPTEADRAFADSLVESAKAIHPDTVDTDDRTAQAFVDKLNTDEGFADALDFWYALVTGGPERGATNEETARNERIHRSVAATIDTRNGLWKSAFASTKAGKPVNPDVKQKIRSMIKALPLQYMQAYALASGDDTWLPGETDREKIRRLDTSGLLSDEYLEGLNPHETAALLVKIQSDQIRQKIKDNDLRADDPMLDA